MAHHDPSITLTSCRPAANGCVFSGRSRDHFRAWRSPAEIRIRLAGPRVIDDDFGRLRGVGVMLRLGGREQPDGLPCFANLGLPFQVHPHLAGRGSVWANTQIDFTKFHQTARFLRLSSGREGCVVSCLASLRAIVPHPQPRPLPHPCTRHGPRRLIPRFFWSYPRGLRVTAFSVAFRSAPERIAPGSPFWKRSPRGSQSHRPCGYPLGLFLSWRRPCR